MRRWSRLGLIVTLMMVFGVSMALPTQAADVTIAAGDTQGLINAINQVNKAGKAAIIDLAPNATYTATAIDHSPIYLFGKQQNMGTTGPDAFPVITANITINGNGSTITRSSSAMFRFFETFQTGTLTLNDMTLTNGNVNDGNGDSGGAVSQIAGTLVLNNCALTGNQAEDGGAVDVIGTATISHTRIENNSSADNGGGIDVESVAFLGRGLTIDDSDIDNNHANEGGGISVTGTAVITNSRIENNVADTEGGGIYIDENGSVNISKGTIIGANQTVNDGSGAVGPFGGAGIDSYFGSLTVDGSVISDNISAFVAGAFFDRGGTFNITHTLITRNQGRNVGGIYSLNIAPSDETLQRDGHITVANSCVVDNTDTDAQSKGMREGIVNDDPEGSNTTINAVNNWWGDTSGPGVVANGRSGGKGKGDGVSTLVNYQPFLNAEPDTCTQAAASATPVVAAPIQPTPTSEQSSDNNSAGVPGFAGCTQPSDGSFQITIPANAWPVGSMVTCNLDGSAFSLIVLSSSGAPLEKFAAPVTICLQGSGTMSYMGLANAGGLPASIKTSQKNGYTCANLPGPGILIMNG